MSDQSPQAAACLADCLSVCLMYGRLLVQDIPAEKFWRLPRARMNHPAFLLGHITVSTDRALAALGRPELGVTPEGYAELFENGRECLEEKGRYPSKDEIVEYYLQRNEQAVEVLRITPWEVLERENPSPGRLREMFPTVGAMVNFAVNCHHMGHLGQISAWRRVMGMGPVLNV